MAQKFDFGLSSAVNVSHRFQNPNHLREILKWNLDSLVLNQHPYKPFKTFSLNDLLVTNANALELHDVTLYVRDLNRFFKLWMKKMFNPRLEYLHVRTSDGNVNKDILLEGLNAVQVSHETKRTFRVLGNVKQQYSWEKIAAEFDITRADGRTATIRFGESHRMESIYFYVWPGSTNDQSLLVSLFMSESSIASFCSVSFCPA
ncbi:hypothetical protein GCK72_012752 [Caenorhabditis remanei]|uniref:Sdz-33 F-box domain-containing protein n=1 Tax=Caenorhabditis remanei TaxID=31234 RepID=A0A6A5GP86_CAERE|nr:hypothetical protein GCK72_012752 [Caenorhabditis remanei]KAF1756299.1 hypothetical protein GCK72_012752 [Caenorhabditis remanei]